MQRSALVCFAVREEAAPFQQTVTGQSYCKVLITGMGKGNAESAIRSAQAKEKPSLVLTCGFAGGLNPALQTGTVIFSVDSEANLDAALTSAGAQPARIHCAERVAATATEKRALRESTGADAVEMESGVIRAICREQKIPSATIRVILDIADEDLPLDFNRLMTPDQRMDYFKLALSVVKSPGKIAALLRLQKQSAAAARELARVLCSVLKL